jgi:hypothetical protein
MNIMISELTTTTISYTISPAVVHLGIFLAPSTLEITLHSTIGHIIQVSHKGLFEMPSPNAYALGYSIELRSVQS